MEVPAKNSIFEVDGVEQYPVENYVEGFWVYSDSYMDQTPIILVGDTWYVYQDEPHTVSLIKSLPNKKIKPMDNIQLFNIGGQIYQTSEQIAGILIKEIYAFIKVSDSWVVLVPNVDFLVQPITNIVVLDFDCTLTYAHTYYFFTHLDQFIEYDNGIWTQGYTKKQLKDLANFLDDKFLDIDTFRADEVDEKNKDMFIDIIFGGKDRLQKIKEFLTDLSKYAKLYISSNQYYYTIVGSLILGGLDKFFLEPEIEEEEEKIYRVNANESIYNQDDKALFIYKLHDKNPTANIHYIDDDVKDNNEFIETNSGIKPDYYLYYGENIGLNINETGLTKEMMDNILNFIKTYIRETQPEEISSPLNPRQLKALSGPSLFAHYPNINGRNILILGEEHDNLLLCNKSIKDAYEIHKWLYDLVKTSPECVDIMMEIPYLREKQSLPTALSGPVKELTNNMYPSPLHAIVHQFYECYSKQKPENCISDKLRLHYIDLRQTDADYDVIHYLSKTPNIPKNILSKYLPKQKILYDYIMAYDTSEEARKIYHSFFNDIHNFHKHVLDINKLDSFTKTFWEIITKEFNKLDMSEEDKYNFYQTIHNTYIKIGNLFGLAGAKIFMDVYALLRMFIKFDSKKSRSSCPDTMKNIIIVTGMNHSEFYMEFFNTYFGQNPDDKTFVLMNNLLGGAVNKCILFEKPFDFFQHV